MAIVIVLCGHLAPTGQGAAAAGTTALLAAIVDAVDVALAPEGVPPIDMPARAESVWRGMSAAEGGR